MGIKDARNKIISLVSGLEAGLGFATTYYEMPTDVVQTPAVAILTSGGAEDPLSFGNNSQLCQFTIRCMVEKTDSSDDDKTQTDKLLDLVDGVFAEMRKRSNETLSGDSYTVEFPSFEKIDVGEVGNLHVFFLDIVVLAKSCRSTL